uniref:Uncharacterized protein n=1 Tax=Cucumis melo TaxID=3656 RepID=A0A9I9EJ74_CUCME
MKQLMVFIESKLEDKKAEKFPLELLVGVQFHLFVTRAFCHLSPIFGKLSDLKKEDFYLGPPSKDKFPKKENFNYRRQQMAVSSIRVPIPISEIRSVLMGAISYAKLGLVNSSKESSRKMPAYYQISFLVPSLVRFGFDRDVIRGIFILAVTDVIENGGETPKKKLYELKLSLLEEIGWCLLVSYEKQWMHVRFPSGLPLF